MLLTVPIKYAKGEKTLRKILFDYIFRNLFVLNATLDIAPDGALVLFVVQDVVKKLLLNHLLALLLVMLLKSRNQYSKIISREMLFFRCSFWRLHYDLKDANGNVVLSIIGPGCICDGPYSCCCENKFTVRVIIYI
jgi:hypothetical protein